MQCFLQIANDGGTSVVDVSQITHVDVHGKVATVHFAGGTKAKLKTSEVELLLDGIRELAGRKLLVTHCATGVAAGKG